MQNTANVMIMAGGAGTRLWPASTNEHPKQFIAMHQEQSMLRASFERALQLCPQENIYILTAENLRSLCQLACPELKKEQIIAEPCRRDTSAAILFGLCHIIREHGTQNNVVVLTADHHIAPTEIFCEDIAFALAQAQQHHCICTLGIEATYPATGFGYLACERGSTDSSWVVQEFKEKPALGLATEYLQVNAQTRKNEGRGLYYLWNSGMFIAESQVLMDAFKEFLPEHFRLLTEAISFDKKRPLNSLQINKAFESLEKISFDYGIMEHMREVISVPAHFEWSDLGCFSAVYDILKKDSEENAANSKSLFIESSGNLSFNTQKDEEVIFFGVEKLVVVRAGNKTLVTTLEYSERIKELLQRF